MPYLSFVEETGTELLFIWVKWACFRRKASEGGFDIYTDIESRIVHYRRVARFLTFFCLVEWGIALSMLVSLWLNSGSGMEYDGIFDAVSCLLPLAFGGVMLCTAGRMRRRYKRLEKEKPFLE